MEEQNKTEQEIIKEEELTETVEPVVVKERKINVCTSCEG